MKKLLGILTVTLMTATSLASTSQSGNALSGKHIATVVQPKIVTRSVPVHVSAPRIPKFKVLRSNPYRYSKITIDDVDVEVDDEGLMSPYRRRDIIKIEHEEGISDDIRWRLFLARQLALLAYREKFGKEIC